jgi:hypothetical protein
MQGPPGPLVRAAGVKRSPATCKCSGSNCPMQGPVEETLTGYDRKTIKKYLLAPDARPVYGPRSGPVSKLVPFRILGLG